MMKNRFYSILNYLVVILVIILISCSNQKILQQTKSQQSVTVSNYISEHFNQNDSIETIPNKDSTLILYLSNKTDKRVNPIGNVNFFVYNLSNDSIIYKNNFSNSKVIWYSNDELLLTRYFGIIQPDKIDNREDYIIHIKTGKKTIYNKNNLK